MFVRVSEFGVPASYALQVSPEWRAIVELHLKTARQIVPLPRPSYAQARHWQMVLSSNVGDPKPGKVFLLMSGNMDSPKPCKVTVQAVLAFLILLHACSPCGFCVEVYGRWLFRLTFGLKTTPWQNCFSPAVRSQKRNATLGTVPKLANVVEAKCLNAGFAAVMFISGRQVLGGRRQRDAFRGVLVRHVSTSFRRGCCGKTQVAVEACQWFQEASSSLALWGVCPSLTAYKDPDS